MTPAANPIMPSISRRGVLRKNSTGSVPSAVRAQVPSVARNAWATGSPRSSGSSGPMRLECSLTQSNVEADLGLGLWDLGFGLWDLGFGTHPPTPSFPARYSTAPFTVASRL